MTRVLAWLGGIIFIASLALTAWWYFVSLGQPVPFAGLRPAVFDAALVTVFALHHSLFARESVKRALRIVPPPMMRSVYVWVASVLLIVVILLWQSVGGEWYHVTGPRAFAHAFVQAFGVWLISRAAAGIDPLELAGIRQVRGLRTRPETLQIGGPYRWVRHPLYLGWILTLFGAAHMTGDRLTFAVLTSAYLFLAVPWEERSLQQSFGEEYVGYAARVRWRIVPFIY